MLSGFLALVQGHKLIAGAIGLAAAAALIFGAVWAIRESGKSEIRQENAVAVGKAQVRGAEARETAATERGNDAATVAAQHEERNDAIHSGPDARPSAVTISRRCVQLRQQGHDLSTVPECGGRPSPPKAAPKR